MGFAQRYTRRGVSRCRGSHGLFIGDSQYGARISTTYKDWALD